MSLPLPKNSICVLYRRDSKHRRHRYLISALLRRIPSSLAQTRLSSVDPHTSPIQRDVCGPSKHHPAQCDVSGFVVAASPPSRAVYLATATPACPSPFSVMSAFKRISRALALRPTTYTALIRT
ncbi:unnamed protein product [Camellia sinensis]